MVESAAATTLDQHKENLLAFAKKHLDAYDTYNVVLTSSKVPGLEVRQTKDADVGGTVVTISKGTIAGLTVDKYKEFKENIVTHTPVLDPKLTMTKMEDCEGHIVTHTHIKMPMFMTDRSIFNLYFQYEDADGSWVDLCSYHGTEAIAESEAGKKLAGKNVVGQNIIDYRILTPTEDGCNFISILCTDVGGSLPVALQNQGAG